MSLTVRRSFAPFARHSVGGLVAKYNLVEITAIAMLSISCILVGIGDLKLVFIKNNADATEVPTEADGEAQTTQQADEDNQIYESTYDEHNIASFVVWTAVIGVLLFPFLSKYLLKGKRVLADLDSISLKRVRHLVYASFPEALFSAVLVVSYFISESVGCLLHEPEAKYCVDIISSNACFSLVFAVGLLHKGYVEPFPKLSFTSIELMTLNFR